MTFRKQLLAERQRLDLTQQQLADILGVGKRTVQEWEDDRKSAPTEIAQEGALARLAKLPTKVWPVAKTDPTPIEPVPEIREW